MMGDLPYIIAIAGGIGCGKSVVSHVVSAMGYPVYDCDSNAKLLMDGSDSIKTSIADSISSACIKGGAIDRATLAEIVFNDAEKLTCLNTIVHTAVREHFMSWINDNAQRAKAVCFIETAILYQSGLDSAVNEVWTVDAPLELRIARVMQRNRLSRDNVLSRISSQDSFVPASIHPNSVIITNDGDTPLLPRIEQLLSDLPFRVK